jgi:very-short-patch-repair endonuclease
MRDPRRLHRNSSGKRCARPTDAAIAELAGRQYGVVSRSQLRELGLGDDEIDYRLAVRRLIALHRGVFAVGHDRVPREGRWLAGVLACGPGAVLSHRSAAALWELLTYEGKVEIAARAYRRKRDGLVTRRAAIQPDERTLYRAVPTTTVARTLLDVGAVASAEKVRKAVEQAEVLGLFDLGEVQLLVDRYPRRPGTAALREAVRVIADSAGRTRQELEERFRSLVLSANLPAPVYNATLELGALTIEADAYWRDHGLVVELDSRAYHGTSAAFDRDRMRDQHALAAGLRVMRITWNHLTRQERATVRNLRKALAQPRAQRLPQ